MRCTQMNSENKKEQQNKEQQTNQQIKKEPEKEKEKNKKHKHKRKNKQQDFKDLLEVAQGEITPKVRFKNTSILIPCGKDGHMGVIGRVFQKERQIKTFNYGKTLNNDNVETVEGFFKPTKEQQQEAKVETSVFAGRDKDGNLIFNDEDAEQLGN